MLALAFDLAAAERWMELQKEATEGVRERVYL
jgi:hypothetical protein